MTYEELESKINEHYAAIKKHKQEIAKIQKEYDMAVLYKELEKAKNRLHYEYNELMSPGWNSTRNTAAETTARALQEEIYRRKGLLYEDPEQKMVRKPGFDPKPSFDYSETETMPELVEGEDSYLEIN